MKVLIIANSVKHHFVNGECIPTCFMPLHGDLTIIQRIFSLLSVSGFAPEDICVYLGKGALWESDNVLKHINNIHVKKIFTNELDMLESHLFEYDFFKNEDLLIIDGTNVIDLAIITRLLRYKERDVIVIKDVLSPDNGKKLLVVKDGKIETIDNSENIKYPWAGFAGVCKFSKEYISVLSKKLIQPLHLMDAVSLTLDSYIIKAVDYDDLSYGIIRSGHSNELIGGSYSKLNYRLVVKKEAEGEGREKLKNEIEWLMSIPEELKPYFSSVLEYDISSPKVYYNVPYYGSRNLREQIFAGNYNADDVTLFLSNLLRWMFNNVYCRKIGIASDRWTIEKHIDRVLDRLNECCVKSSDLKRLIEAEKLIINGRIYRNIREIYEKIKGRDDFIQKVNPKDLVMIHGDLHFQNILLSNETDTGFILVDPRGEHEGSDVYYDLGKVFHSLHGKYDFIHSDQFRLEINYNSVIPDIKYVFTNQYMVREYDIIYEQFLKVISDIEYIKNDENWLMKCLWSEASHFCSVMTFHVEKSNTPDRVMLLYLTGVVLINEFVDRYLNLNYS